MVEELYEGQDGVVRAVKLRAGKTFIERAINHLYPLELSCDRTDSKLSDHLNPEAPTFRPTRDAAVAATPRPRERFVNGNICIFHTFQETVGSHHFVLCVETSTPSACCSVVQIAVYKHYFDNSAAELFFKIKTTSNF